MQTGVVTMEAKDFETLEDANNNNDYEIGITATDSDGNTATKTWTVNVADDDTEIANFTIDNIPETETIAENTFYTGATPELSGDDPIGTVTYTLEGADKDLFSIDTETGVVTMQAKDFETLEDANNNNDYEIGITATDSDGNTATKTWTVNVADDDTEIANFTIDDIPDATIVENTIYTGATPELSGDDPIGTVTYTLEGADKDLFSIDTETGVVTMQAKDFETLEDANNNNDYEIGITATDSDGNTATKTWTVNVADDDTEIANFTIDNIPETETIAENTFYTGATPELSGDDPIGAVIYTISGGADQNLFFINATGVVTMEAKDFETLEDANNNNDYEIGITATDSDGNTATKTWTVNVADDDTEIANFTIDNIPETETIAENTFYTGATPELSGDDPIGTVTYTLEGADKDLFSIDTETGVVTMQVKDFETLEDANNNNDYEIGITATDSDGNTATKTWTVNVADDDTEIANFTIDNIPETETIAENTFYTGATPELSGDDPIGTVTYTLEGADKDLFSIDTETGVVTMQAKDFETLEDANNNNDYEIGITATDSDGNTATKTWTVNVADDDTEIANFTIDDIPDATIVENTIYTGATPELSGDDPIGTVTYTLEGADKDLFSIDTETGVVTMQAKDFETLEDANNNNDYEIGITATDSDGNTATKTWTVNVADDDTEIANFTIDNIPETETIAENTFYTGATPELSGDDPIGTVTYTLEGADQRPFLYRYRNRSSYYAG